jgi:hypothetical protein
VGDDHRTILSRCKTGRSLYSGSNSTFIDGQHKSEDRRDGMIMLGTFELLRKENGGWKRQQEPETSLEDNVPKRINTADCRMVAV